MTAPTIVQPDNVAVVTGAALGIGRAMCRRFAEAGMSVVVADLPGEELDRTVDALKAISPRGPDGILKEPTDVADPEQVERLRDTVMTKFGKVNLLANNAATRIGREYDAPLADWRRAMDVNLWGPIHGVRTFLPVMLASTEPGVIVNVGSKQGITNPPGHTVYNMTKAALKAYTEALEHELRSSPGNAGPSRDGSPAHPWMDDHRRAGAQAWRLAARTGRRRDAVRDCPWRLLYYLSRR
jgi:NAD(P)-dependent dehydrogenase (short-subunit alcohol dehydrogenase family)